MIHDTIESASAKRVLFIGEEIEDVYHYGRLLARPLKEPIICIEYQRTEAFQGGVIAAARHAETFCRVVHTASARRVRKDRYIEEGKERKLFEVYAGSSALVSAVFPSFATYDCVVVTDFGHGMIDDALIERLQDAKFLAVNVQTNAGNYGFNLATKYPRADYLCMDEPEARLATQNRDGAIERSLEELCGISPRVVVTLGRKGSIGTGGVHVPAFLSPVVDTMGAGDAFFAVTAPMAENAPMVDLLTIGNAAGKLKAMVVGHRQSVTKHELIAYLANQGR